jgi:hypothetical protein
MAGMSLRPEPPEYSDRGLGLKLSAPAHHFGGLAHGDELPSSTAKVAPAEDDESCSEYSRSDSDEEMGLSEVTHVESAYVRNASEMVRAGFLRKVRTRVLARVPEAFSHRLWP